jgi:beta-lactamase regulating signal transducer with metallopeptidase domain
MSGTTVVEWLLRTLVGGGCLLLLAWLVMGRLAAPALRQRLGEWAIAAALLLALLSVAPAWLIVPLPAEVVATEAPPPPVVTTSSSVPPPEGAPSEASEPVPLIVPGLFAVEPAAMDLGEIPASPVPAAASREGPTQATAGRTPANDEASAIRWLPAAILLYLACAALLLARWLLGHLVLWRLLRRREIVPPAVADLFQSMTASCQRARLVLSRRAHVPFSCGLLRPTVVLPATLAETASPRLLRWIFAHELTHLRRGDARTSLLFGLGQALYFPLPWFWRLRRQVRLCQEFIADAAAAALGPAEDYAQFLVSWTAAPRVPAGVLGVGGSSSDLFRRITMLLQSSAPVEPHCPRRWSLLAAGGLLGLAVLVAGVGLAVQAAPVPQKKNQKKDETKKEDTKKDDTKKDDAVPDNLKDLPPGVEGELRQRYLKQQMDMMRQMQQRFGAVAPGGGIGAAWNPRHTSRLGAHVEPPSATLAEQLDLPKGRGLVLKEVLPDSAAEKAGLKPHDILLELNGEKVPNEVEGLKRLMADIKPDAAVEAVVLRKGKTEKIKGLKLPEAKEAQPGFPAFAPGNFQPPGGGVAAPAFPGGGGWGVFTAPGGAGRTVMTTMFRTDDRFTTRHQEGSLIITLTGKAADGKAKVHDIHVQDGGQTSKYESLDKVPEQYRDKVKNLIEMSEKSGGRIDIKSP